MSQRSVSSQSTPQEPSSSSALGCEVCGKESPPQSYYVSDPFDDHSSVFRYLVCKVCGSLQIEKPPTDIGRYYRSSQYYSHRPSDVLDIILGLVRSKASLVAGGRLYDLLRAHSLLDDSLCLLGRVQPDKLSKILDVGCGSGRLLQQLHWLGFTDLHGIDPFGTTRNARGVEIIRTDIGAYEAQTNFDLVMFHHSLEHVARPSADLLKARRLLKPGGSLIIRIPVISWAFEVYGGQWAGLDPPRHLTIPTVLGLQRLLGRTGFVLTDGYFDSNEWQILNSGPESKKFRDWSRGRGGALMTKLFSAEARVAYGRARELNALGLADSIAVIARASETGDGTPAL